MLDIQDALSLLENRDARDAARLLEQMVAEMPAYAAAYVLLARSYEALDDWGRASTIWRDALQIMPGSPAIREGLKRAASRSAGRRSRSQAEEESEFHDETTLRAQDVSPPMHLPPEEHLPPPGETPSADEMPGADEMPRAEEMPPADEMPRAEEMPRADETPRADEAPRPDETPRHYETRRADEAPPPHERPLSPDATDDLSELRDVEDTGTPHFEDLDRLINELESARIVPRPDLDDVPSPDLEDDIEDVVSETLARIYASQGQYDEAARVYELLAGQHPEEADEYLQKASGMRSRASDGD